jgi:hypothetical protein
MSLRAKRTSRTSPDTSVFDPERTRDLISFSTPDTRRHRKSSAQDWPHVAEREAQSRLGPQFVELSFSRLLWRR